MTTLQEDQTTDTEPVVHTLHAMDGSGDSRFTWDPSKPAEVEAAKAQFDTLKGKGYLAYSVQGDGSKGEVIREFDPSARATIMQPQMVGG